MRLILERLRVEPEVFFPVKDFDISRGYWDFPAAPAAVAGIFCPSM